MSYLPIKHYLKKKIIFPKDFFNFMLTQKIGSTKLASREFIGVGGVAQLGEQ